MINQNEQGNEGANERLGNQGDRHPTRREHHADVPADGDLAKRSHDETRSPESDDLGKGQGSDSQTRHKSPDPMSSDPFKK